MVVKMVDKSAACKACRKAGLTADHWEVLMVLTMAGATVLTTAGKKAASKDPSMVVMTVDNSAAD